MGAAAPHLDNPAPLPPHSLAALARAATKGAPSQNPMMMVMFAARPRANSAQLVRPNGHNDFGGCPHSECSQLGIARAHAWDGGVTGYTMDPHPVCSAADPHCRNSSSPDGRTFCEDPFVWHDDADQSYHL
eukprot:5626401-Prymnesium_polylepis.1